MYRDRIVSDQSGETFYGGDTMLDSRLSMWQTDMQYHAIELLGRNRPEVWHDS